MNACLIFILRIFTCIFYLCKIHHLETEPKPISTESADIPRAVTPSLDKKNSPQIAPKPDSREELSAPVTFTAPVVMQHQSSSSMSHNGKMYYLITVSLYIY